ncbi:MAG: hypothetical protein ACOX3T_04435 [Bdellovibrionota bacterium]
MNATGSVNSGAAMMVSNATMVPNSGNGRRESSRNGNPENPSAKKQARKLFSELVKEHPNKMFAKREVGDWLKNRGITSKNICKHVLRILEESGLIAGESPRNTKRAIKNGRRRNA